MLDFLVKLEDGLLDVVGIQLVFVGEFCDHHVVGVESMLHHPQHHGCAATHHASQWFEGVAAPPQGRD